MRISPGAGLVFKGHLHLMSTSPRDDVARKDRSIVGDDDRRLVAALNVDGDSVEMVAVLLEGIKLGAFFRDGLDGQHDFVRPLLDGNFQLKSLPLSITPPNEVFAVFSVRQTFDDVR